ncbi:CopG family antitoxin [Mesobacillus campisalis]|nr:CopG family antitoxin [Mesobacillus campisalis]
MNEVNKEAKEMINKIFEDEVREKSLKEKEYDELGRLIIHDISEVPENMTEEETVRYWETHAMSEDLMEETYIEEDDEDLPPPRKQSTRPINLRIENDLLVRLQKIADIKQIPYQTLLKQFVAERVYEEEKREKILT